MRNRARLLAAAALLLAFSGRARASGRSVQAPKVKALDLPGQPLTPAQDASPSLTVNAVVLANALTAVAPFPSQNPSFEGVPPLPQAIVVQAAEREQDLPVLGPDMTLTLPRLAASEQEQPRAPERDSLLDRLFDNSARAAKELKAALGFNPTTISGSILSDPHKSTTRVLRVTPHGKSARMEEAVVKHASYDVVRKELFARNVLNELPELFGEIGTVPAAGYKRLHPGLGVLVMPYARDVKSTLDLTIPQKAALAALGYALGVEDINGDGVLKPKDGGKPVVIDFERGLTKLGDSGLGHSRLLFSSQHFNDYADYAPAVEAWKRLLSERPERVKELLSKSGFRGRAVDRAMDVLRSNASNMESLIKSAIKRADEEFARDAARWSLSEAQAAKLSALNHGVLNGGSTRARDHVRRFNAGYDENWKYLAPDRPALSASEWASFLKAGGRVELDPATPAAAVEASPFAALAAPDLAALDSRGKPRPAGAARLLPAFVRTLLEKPAEPMSLEEDLIRKDLVRVHELLKAGDAQRAVDELDRSFAGDGAREFFRANSGLEPYRRAAMAYYRAVESVMAADHAAVKARAKDPAILAESKQLTAERLGSVDLKTKVQETNELCAFHALHNAVADSVGWAGGLSVEAFIAAARAAVDAAGRPVVPSKIGVDSSSMLSLTRWLNLPFAWRKTPSTEAELLAVLRGGSKVILGLRRFTDKHKYPALKAQALGHAHIPNQHAVHLYGAYKSALLGRWLFLVQDSSSGATEFYTFGELRRLTMELGELSPEKPVGVPN